MLKPVAQAFGCVLPQPHCTDVGEASAGANHSDDSLACAAWTKDTSLGMNTGTYGRHGRTPISATDAEDPYVFSTLLRDRLLENQRQCRRIRSTQARWSNHTFGSASIGVIGAWALTCVA
jgi:hypothetical protein